jgi:predicted phage tail protein
MVLPFLVSLAVSLALNVVAYLIMPKPKAAKPAAAADLDAPTAEAGRPIPVIFGTLTVAGLNVLWHGDKKVYEYDIKTSS